MLTVLKTEKGYWTQILHRRMDNNLLYTASRGLTVGADIDYVVVQPAGESRKLFVVASELLNSLSEKFGWTGCSSFGYLPWSRIKPHRDSSPDGYGQMQLVILRPRYD